jgi:hypothetical protein
MKLSVKERMQVLSILPKEGDFVTLRIVRDMQKDLSFSEKEIKELDLKAVDGKYGWKPDKDTNKDIPIGDKANDIITGELKKLDKEKKLKLEMFNLYEKFIKE